MFFYIVLGNIYVMVVVYGLVEVRLSKEFIDKVILEVVFRFKVGLLGI